MSDHSFIVTENGVIVEILCKLCRAPIQSMQAAEKYVRVERVNKQIVKTVPVYLRPNPNYRQIVLEVSDGERKAKHVTHCCASCLETLERQSLQKMYLEDLQQFAREGMDSKYIAHFMKFAPTKVIGEEALYE